MLSCSSKTAKEVFVSRLLPSVLLLTCPLDICTVVLNMFNYRCFVGSLCTEILYINSFVMSSWFNIYSHIFILIKLA